MENSPVTSMLLSTLPSMSNRSISMQFQCFNRQPQKDGQSYLNQIQDQFPEANTLLNGYCGVQFKNQPPKQCEFDMTTELDVESGEEFMKFVCKGQLHGRKLVLWPSYHGWCLSQ